MDLNDWANVANILGVTAAVIVYVANSVAARRQRMIENLERYFGAHNRAFASDSYPILNVLAMEKGTFERDPSNEEMEYKFNRFLSDVEQIALLHNAGAVPKSMNAYMLGWFAKHLYPALTDRERAEPYWALAIEFLKQTRLEAESMDKRSAEDLLHHIKQQHAK